MSGVEYSSAQIADIIGGSVLQMSLPQHPISHLLMDSRKLLFPERSLFFAVKGSRLNGHDYIPELYKQGVRSFVVTEPINHAHLPDANIIEVENSVNALQKLAAHHRSRFNIPVIGITGSNGKTVVKEWLYQLLHQDYHVVRSPKSYNSQIGVPLSVWLMDEHFELGIFEAGLSEPGEMERLESIVKPRIGIFTNIGEAHQENFLNITHKALEKLKLFVNAEIVIYCKDHPDVNQAIAQASQLLNFGDDDKKKFRTLSWSLQSDADLRVKKETVDGNGCKLNCAYKGENFVLTLPFQDAASIENAIHCVAAMLYMNCPIPAIQERTPELGRIAMRLELKDAVNNSSLINDSYNSDLSSLRIALDFLHQQMQHERKTLILSDIFQSGKSDYDLYQEVAEMVKNSEVNRMIGIGESLERQHAIFEKLEELELELYPNTEEFLKEIQLDSFRNEAILLKGSRKFRFEKISKHLERKVHETVLEINLNALTHNLKTYQNLLEPGVKTMAMVKAFSYGSGTYEIANLLTYNRVDYLAVAYADEGVELRKAGIELPIMIMNPESRSFETMISYQLEPEIYSMSLLQRFLKVVRVMSNEDDERFPIHLKLDTGMRRLGFEEHEIDELCERLLASDLIKVKTIFSHLAGSETAEHDEFTKEQIQRFERMSARIDSLLAYPIDRHLVNSAGIARHKNAHYDMVRLGLGLYGIDTSGRLKGKLQTVSTLKATISQIKKVKAGETIGYGRAGKATEDMKVATIGIGYADGLNRHLSNGIGEMLIRGQRAKTIGNICMDMCMLDVSQVEGVREGDEVIIFGEDPPITELSDKLGTIPYEILTSISGRVKRIYFQE